MENIFIGINEQELREQTASMYQNKAYLSARFGNISSAPFIPRPSDITSVGVGTPVIISDNDQVNLANVTHKLNSIPSTPIEVPSSPMSDSSSSSPIEMTGPNEWNSITNKEQLARE